jgi:hypothetical protein
MVNPVGVYSDMFETSVRVYSDDAQTITFGDSFRSIDTLPTTTIAGKTIYLTFAYNIKDNKFDLVNATNEGEGLSDKEDKANKGAINGYAPLDSNQKVPVGNLPTQMMEFEGNWDASTNTPTLSNTDTGLKGTVYYCNVSGTVDFGAGNIIFAVGDWATNNGTIWQRGNNSGKVILTETITQDDSLGNGTVTTSTTAIDGFTLQIERNTANYFKAQVVNNTGVSKDITWAAQSYGSILWTENGSLVTTANGSFVNLNSIVYFSATQNSTCRADIVVDGVQYLATFFGMKIGSNYTVLLTFTKIN